MIVLVLLVRACSGHENQYEKIARELTQAVQNNDYDARREARERARRPPRWGTAGSAHAADAFAPLGKIKSVKENTPADDGDRVHEFDVTFENGVVHEKIQFDPRDKVFKFKYDAHRAG